MACGYNYNLDTSSESEVDLEYQTKPYLYEPLNSEIDDETCVIEVIHEAVISSESQTSSSNDENRDEWLIHVHTLFF